jgi:hypothetical protein
MSRLLLFVFVALFSLAQVQAWTIPLAGLGTSPPPSILLTTDISPQCEAVNNGTLLCCETTVAGGVPAVQLAAQLAGYELPANTLNGVLCEYFSFLIDDIVGGETEGR